jgi:hypothetical protein
VDLLSSEKSMLVFVVRVIEKIAETSGSSSWAPDSENK